MFDFGWSEIVVIGAIALVVIGPKDLPKALRTGGMLMRRARGMAREFQNSIDDMVREAELEDIRKAAEKIVRKDSRTILKDHLDPTGELEAALNPEATAPVPVPVAEPSPVAPSAPVTPPETKHD
ncbi:MAG TPA: Sec-independent protein translocase protein TatB [Aliidongia sp.]|nr:Sec-independent protein translocase protein TatB [Aliidongia sp.]